MAGLILGGGDRQPAFLYFERTFGTRVGELRVAEITVPWRVGGPAGRADPRSVDAFGPEILHHDRCQRARSRSGPCRRRRHGAMYQYPRCESDDPVHELSASKVGS